MELEPPLAAVRVANTHRLIPSRYPPVGVFDAVSAPEDLDHIFDLEGWTNDRLQAELGQLNLIPRSGWVLGVPNASVVMAAFCHPHRGGARFTGPDLGAWYAGFSLETAHKETIHRRAQELREVATLDLVVQVRQYLADFDASFHDVRDVAKFATLYDAGSYTVSQPFGVGLRQAGSDGMVYKSVRDPGGDCLVAFKPKLVTNVRQGTHFEYVWAGSLVPSIRRIAEA